MIKRNAGLNPLTETDWLHVFPVPFRDRIYLFILPSVTGTANIQLLDVSGRQILTKSISVKEGQLQLVEYLINRPLPAGAYFIQYIDPMKTKTFKLLKN